MSRVNPLSQGDFRVAGQAMHLAALHPEQRLVLLTPFDRLLAVARGAMLWLPAPSSTVPVRVESSTMPASAHTASPTRLAATNGAPRLRRATGDGMAPYNTCAREERAASEQWVSARANTRRRGPQAEPSGLPWLRIRRKSANP